ncbi:hypothetical protein JW752_00780 [Candidatus Peregrinibacteria bacterium]|nr:hypothetical protein [Candidatus Peregrinibacteria bacterium]
MLEMYKTPLDILYLVLSVGGGLLLLVLIIAVLHLIGILSNVRKVTRKAKDTVDLINHYLWQPIKVMMRIMERSKEYAAKQARKKK